MKINDDDDIDDMTASSVNDDDWPYMNYAQFTPHQNAIVMVYNYDIYYCQGARSQYVQRITHNAMPGIIYNGIPDWLYEGE